MAPATQRRSRRGSGSQRASQASADGFLEAPAALSPCGVTEVKDAVAEGEEGGASAQGFSILKEIFPEHGVTPDLKAMAPAPCVLTQLLGSVPSPSRSNMFGNGNGSAPPPSGMAFGPPAHTPMNFGAPAGPPPPPTMPAPTYQERWAPPQTAAPRLPEACFGSYRERLRAGGRGAFQRAFDSGLMPKNMKQDSQQDWNGMHMQATTPQGMPSQMPDGQNGATMSYDGSQCQMWGGPAGQMQQSNDYCGYAMQAPQMQMQMLPQMAVQQPMQMVPMQQGEQSPQQMIQMQLPPMAMSQPQTPSASGYSTPTSIDSVRAECMAIVMPQASQFPCGDQDMLAAQLKAMAESQGCYED